MENPAYEEQMPLDDLQDEALDPAEITPQPGEPSLLDRLRSLWQDRGKYKLTTRTPQPKQKKRRKLKDLPKFDEEIQPAMERLTDELIAETVGEDGVLTREFREQLERYDPDVNPIGPVESRAIIMSMLDLAAAQRKLLNERLERSVEVGTLYDTYYGRVQTVNMLAAEAMTALERMDLSEEDYRYHSGVLLQVRDASVRDDLKPGENANKRIAELQRLMNSRNVDIMKELDERGGAI